MNDQELFQYYLAMREQEPHQWNLSPKSLYMELETRDFLTRNYQPVAADSSSPGTSIKACNIGIGVGEWDDFLGYFIAGKGQLTSVDINREICEVFKYRQQREGHTNPSHVVCEDFTRASLPENEYDLVTIIGSTLQESGKTKEVFAKTHEIMKVDGYLFVMNLEKYSSFQATLDSLQAASFVLETSEKFNRFSGVEFYCLGLRKKQ